jgi:hypothetical protein
MTLLLFVLCLNSIANTSCKQKISDTGYNNSQPLRLNNFVARVLASHQIELNWLTAETWTNVTHYEIYRSVNNIDFSYAGSVAQISAAPIDQQYRFTDYLTNTAASNTVYYKLKQVNLNGYESWSFILTVRLQTGKVSEISTWPNPVQNELHFNFQNTSDNQITISYTEVSGKIVLKEKIQAEKGSCFYRSTGVRELKKGIYFIRLESETEIIGTKTIIKQ